MPYRVHNILGICVFVQPLAAERSEAHIWSFSSDEFFVRKGGVYPRLRRFGVLGRKSTAPPEAWAGLVTAAPKQSRTKDKRRGGAAPGGGAQRATP